MVEGKLEDMADYDYIIVGSGLSAAVISRCLADFGKKLLVIEKRNHIGGNLYDEKNEDGLIVQKYGPHTFHTSNDRVIDFITKYANFIPYKLKCEVDIDGVKTPSPFNFKTIDQFYDVEYAKILKEKLKNKYPNGKATVVELLSDNDKTISNYASLLFEKDYSLYTSKQWGISPREVDVSVLKRVPVEFSYKEYYFYDKFEGIPKDGFMSLIKNLFNSKNIDIITSKNAIEDISIIDNVVFFKGKKAKIIYTGPLDEFFKYKYDELPYRSLKFDIERKINDGLDAAAIIAYPSHKFEFTRITDYSKLPLQNVRYTTLVKEYPQRYIAKINEPYYPILTKDSIIRYQKYFDEASSITGLYLLGRLAEFKYYNMDQVVLNALELFDKLRKE